MFSALASAHIILSLTFPLVLLISVLGENKSLVKQSKLTFTVVLMVVLQMLFFHSICVVF